jgi:hypothetical protein
MQKHKVKGQDKMKSSGVPSKKQKQRLKKFETESLKMMKKKCHRQNSRKVSWMWQ